MNGLTDIFYDVVDSAVSKECKRLSSSLFSEDYLNELTTNQEKALFKLFRNIASLSVKFEKGVAEYSPGIILYGERRTFDLSDMTEEDYLLLSSVNVKSLPTLIRARVSNILWNEKKDFSMVEVAIESYYELYNRLYDTENWTYCVKYIKHAIKEFHTFGKTIKKVSIDEWEKWRNELYHTIGNFTPVPWPIMKYGSINMQDIHKGLDERWDLFLKLCQSEWTYFKKYSIYIDFQSYIKLTCQEIYFVEIYDLFNDKFGTHSIGDLSNEELLSWYDAISTIDLSNKKIVTFGNDLSNDVRNINRLITIRGRLMMALVKKNRQ